MMKSDVLKEFLSLETTVSKPSKEVCEKILNLKGLFDSHIPNWRTLEKTIDVTQPRSNYVNKQIRLEIESREKRERENYKNNSFQSLPTLSSPHYAPKQIIHKVSSADNFRKDNYDRKSGENNLSVKDRSGGKYVSKFKHNDKQIEDKILNTIILSKLNKFSESTYNEIRDFLHQILGSSNQIDNKEKDTIEEFVKEFMNLVFKKAASEEIFCPLYAKLLGEISKEYSIILDEMDKLHQNYLNIFEEEEESDNYDKFIERNKEKKYRQGYSQFLSELIVHKILSVDKITIIFQKIMDQLTFQGMLENKISITDQYIDCLLRITKVLQNKNEDFFINIRQNLFIIVKDPIQNILDNKQKYISISNKSRFLLLNVLDYLKPL